MDDFSDIARSLRLQGGVCGNMGSPFYAGFMARMADDLEAGGPSCALAERWVGLGVRPLFIEAVPIRLANAFNHLAMGDEAPALSAIWPRPHAPVDPDGAWAMAREAIAPHRAMLEAFLDHEPQTNEVRRSAGLLGGFLTVAAETGLPLRAFEIGASAGLNQFWDRFRYELGPLRWGDPASPVRIDTEWTGATPPDVAADVIARAACDRRPTDLADAAQRRRLLANIWPDMFERLERSRRAIDLAEAAGVCVEAADALDWVRARVAVQPGAATVLYHSVFWQYLPPATQAGLDAAIAALGAAATPDAPFAWLRFEPPLTDMTTVDIRLTLWPGGADRRLGEAHPHGAWIRWDA